MNNPTPGSLFGGKELSTKNEETIAQKRENFMVDIRRKERHKTLSKKRMINNLDINARNNV